MVLAVVCPEVTVPGESTAPVVTTAWHTATASESRFADFDPVVVKRTRSALATHSADLVRYELRWLRPEATIDGRATDLAYDYQRAASHQQECFNQVA